LGSWQYLKRARRESRAGKVKSLLDAKLKGVEWGEFRLGDLFEIKNTLSFNKDELTVGNKYDYVTRTSQNQGILQTTGFVNNENINEAGCWSLGLLQMDFFYRHKSWYAGQFVRKIIPKFNLTTSSILFFTILLNKQKEKLLSVLVRNVDTVFKNSKIQLPTKNNKIDFEFMENFIAELEAQKIARLEAYLVENGLKEYRLSQEEEAVLRDFESGNIEWGEFKIGDLFEKLNLKTHKKPFDKVKDTSSIPTDEFSLPLVNAKFGNNGVMFYGREEDFDSAEMTIDIISNGAIATGTVYAQPHKTGVLWDAYLLKAVVDDITKNKLLYLSTSIEKSIKLKFGWDNKAVWSKVQHKLFSLPTKNNQPDYALMQTLISAVQKLVVKDVVLYVESKKGKRI